MLNKYIDAPFLRNKKKVFFSKKKNWEERILATIDMDHFHVTFEEIENLEEGRYDAIIPLSIKDIQFLNRFGSKKNRRKFLIPPPETLNICNDKHQFKRFMTLQGYSDYIPSVGAEDSYPYILKKRIDAWGVNCHIICDNAMQEKYRTLMNSGKYLIQEYISGKSEFTTHIIFSDNQIRFQRTLEFTYREEFYIKGKKFNHSSVEEVHDNAFDWLFEKILIDLKFEGICCFNYKIIEGRPVIFEINPRYGGSLTRFINEVVEVYCGIVA